MRLILFDIDQTLVETAGVGMRCLGRAMHEELGDSMGAILPDGKTDPQILREALAPRGWLETELVPAIERIMSRYVLLMHEALSQADERRRLKPGVAPLLDRLSGHPDVGLGLLTGNFEKTAYLKLGALRLDHYFPVGAFGSDATERDHLGPIAIQRAQAHYRSAFDSVWVVGDTPMDVRAAQATPAQALGVATGRSSVHDLLQAGADAALPDLSNLEQVLAILGLQ